MYSKGANLQPYSKAWAYPPQQGYPPAEQGYPSKGYPTPQQDYAPHQGYAPQQGYAPKQGYAPQPGFTPQGQQQSSTVVVQQPYPGQAIDYENRPPDYFIASILACFCCFWPTGLCAICYASSSRTLLAQGDVEGSARMANNARNLIIASVILGIIWIGIAIVVRGTSNTRTYNY